MKQAIKFESDSAGGGGWIRTNVGARQRIYSPSPLATRAPLRRRDPGTNAKPPPCQRLSHPPPLDPIPLFPPAGKKPPSGQCPGLPRTDVTRSRSMTIHIPASRAHPSWLPSLLGLFIAVGPAATDMYLPSFPAVEAAFGTAPGTAQLTLATWFAGLALGQLTQGSLSDR